MTPCIGLVVPSLAYGGGVPALARFIKDAILRSGRYELKLISLCMASRDPSSLNFFQPRTWARGAVTATGVWDDLPFVHVGAVGGELEFQRYRSRKVLADVLADCDIIQVVCGSPAWANAVVGLGKPVALQVATRVRLERRRRDATPRTIAAWWRKAMTEVTDRMDDKALRSVDAIQVINPWMLAYARKLNQGRVVDVRYAPPGVDTSVFCGAPTRNLSTDPYILCVGRLDDPRKDIGLLLEAYAVLPPDLRGSVRLVLAGMSGPPAAFWVRLQQLGLQSRVEFVHRPSREALVVLYQRASVFALTSDEEGLGVVLLEAMACGVPVVSTRSGGPEGIITEGKDGYLVPLADAAALAARISQLCVDPALNFAMGLKARQTVEQRYAETVTAAAFVDMWDQLLARASTGGVHSRHSPRAQPRNPII